MHISISMGCNNKLFPIFLFIFCFLPFASRASEFRGQVIRVLDGDTIDVMENQTPVRIRLVNIDAPEKKQAYGQWAAKQLKNLLTDKTVVVDCGSTDQYGRLLGRVLVDGIEVNRQMVSLGAAWVYDQYNTDKVLPDLQREAMKQKRGLWAASQPVPPWEWRHKQN